MIVRATTVLLLCAALLALPAAAARAQHLLPADGFNKVAWGTRLDQTPGFHVLANQGPLAIYAQEHSDYSFGGFGVVKIYYAAQDGVFFAAYMRMRNEDMYRQIHNSLRLELGQPERQADTSVEISRWDRGGVLAIMQHSKINNDSRLCYVSQAHADAGTLARADALFATINTSTMERDTWKNPKTFDLDLFIKK